MSALTKDLNPVEYVNVYDYKSVMATLKRSNFELISTNAALHLSDFFILRNSISLIRFLIKIELLTTKVITGKPLGITVYALNKK